jgi:hypothetical protein
MRPVARRSCQRQHEGDIASQTYYDNADAALLEAGDVINQFIPQIYDGTRVVRLIGKDESIKFQRINDPMDPHAVDLGIGKFDVALSTGTSYTTRRVEAAQAMMEAIQVYPELMQIAGDLVVKAQDWPGADELAERLQKTIPPQFLKPEDQQKLLDPPPVSPQVVEQMKQMNCSTSAREHLLEATTRRSNSRNLRFRATIQLTKRIMALNQDRGNETPDDLGALNDLLGHAAKIDEHDIQRAQLEHTIVKDHMEHGLKQDQLAAQREQASASNEIAMKQASTRASASAKPTGSKKSQ